MLSKCKKIAYKFEQKLCGFPDDKNSNRRKLLIREFHETLLKVIYQKTKLIHESCFVLIMDGGLYYDTCRTIVILLAEGIWEGATYMILVSKISIV